MGLGRVERILILAKTYPSPSAQYVETSCVAGITEQGFMRRIYPVPFRMIETGRQFKKWQWIQVRVEKAIRDHRPESHKIYVDTINCQDMVRPSGGWGDRWQWLDKIPSFRSIVELDAARLSERVSLGLVRPKVVSALEIARARNSDWTGEEREKLVREQVQGELFSEADARQDVKTLRKIPFDFYYRFRCDSLDGEKEERGKIVDWEVGALYWNCRRSHGEAWEQPFRAKLEGQLMGRELMLLMGNQHRFQDQWLIVSLVYPPTRKRVENPQGLLL